MIGQTYSKYLRGKYSTKQTHIWILYMYIHTYIPICLVSRIESWKITMCPSIFFNRSNIWPLATRKLSPGRAEKNWGKLGGRKHPQGKGFFVGCIIQKSVMIWTKPHQKHLSYSHFVHCNHLQTWLGLTTTTTTFLRVDGTVRATHTSLSKNCGQLWWCNMQGATLRNPILTDFKTVAVREIWWLVLICWNCLCRQEDNFSDRLVAVQFDWSFWKYGLFKTDP